jgi:hypothetical protein
VFVKGFLPLCCERPQVLRGNELGAVVNVLRVYQVNLLNTGPPGYDNTIFSGLWNSTTNVLIESVIFLGIVRVSFSQPV